jgi:hypothetical protein
MFVHAPASRRRAASRTEERSTIISPSRPVFGVVVFSMFSQSIE